MTISSVIYWVVKAIPIIIMVAVFVGIAGFFIISLCERQHLKGDLAPTVGQSPYEAIPYFSAMKELAGRLGFWHGGDFHTAAGKSKVRGNCSLWASGDGLVLCEIVGTKFCGLPYRRTRLFTFTMAGCSTSVSRTFSSPTSESKKAVAQKDRHKIPRPGDPKYDMVAALEKFKLRG